HALVPGKAEQSRHRIGAQSGLDARGRTCRPAAWIGVAAVERDAIAQPVGERDRDLLRRWRAEADRVRAADVERDAVVSDRRRQIQHVAGAEQPFVLGAEAREDLEREIRLERKVALPADPPSAATFALQ